MTTPVIIDIVAAAVLLAFAAYGGRRGLFRALAGLLSVVVALVGAGMIASALAPPAARLVTPLIAKQIEQRVEDAMAVQSAQSGQVQMPEADTEGTQDQEAEDSVIQNLLEILGLDDEVRTQLAQRVRERIRSTGESLAAAVVESMAQSFLYGALYILSFAVLLAALKLVTRAMDLVLRLPGLHGLNALGGAAIGLAEGALLLFVTVWVLRRLGVSFETGAAAQTHILRIFTANTPLGVLSHLQ